MDRKEYIIYKGNVLKRVKVARVVNTCPRCFLRDNCCDTFHEENQIEGCAIDEYFILESPLVYAMIRECLQED
jgi:hypothetical protein